MERARTRVFAAKNGPQQQDSLWTIQSSRQGHTDEKQICSIFLDLFSDLFVSVPLGSADFYLSHFANGLFVKRSTAAEVSRRSSCDGYKGRGQRYARRSQRNRQCATRGRRCNQITSHRANAQSEFQRRRLCQKRSVAFFA